MAVKIRLTRMGRKKKPYYRINVADSRSPRDGRFIESIGVYDPLANQTQTHVDEGRANYWLDMGAQPSSTVRNLFKSNGILLKRNLTKRGVETSVIEEEMKKWEILQMDRQKRTEQKIEQAKEKKMKKASAEESEAKETAPSEGAKPEMKKKNVSETAPGASSETVNTAPQTQAAPESGEPAEKTT